MTTVTLHVDWSCMEVAIYFWSSNFMCLSVSILHSSVIMKNQLLIPFSGCCLVVCLFVCSWSKTGSREPLLQSVPSSSFFVFIVAFHSKLNNPAPPPSNNPSSRLSSPHQTSLKWKGLRELNRGVIVIQVPLYCLYECCMMKLKNFKSVRNSQIQIQSEQIINCPVLMDSLVWKVHVKV